MLWKLSLVEEYENIFEFCLQSINGNKYSIKSKTPEELRTKIKEYTMGNIKFLENVYPNPLELNLKDIFPISYHDIKDIYKKLGIYAEKFEISEDSLICKCCEQNFTDYRSCMHHINRKGK